MKVEDGKRLFNDAGQGVRWWMSPNKSEGIEPRFLVIHYTAGRGLEQTCNWLGNPKAKASAHLVIGRDGEIIQMVKFDERAWHAGKSRWSSERVDFEGLNRHSIGIELDNQGVLTRDPQGCWRNWWGERVHDREVAVATHKHGGPERGWHRFTEAQVLAAYCACEALIDAFPGIEDVLGHDDIAPGRKLDPGPAFPMEPFRSWLFGRGEG